MTSEDVELYLGLHTGWAAKARLDGGGPPYFLKLGSSVRYRREHVDEWLAEQARRSTAEY